MAKQIIYGEEARKAVKCYGDFLCDIQRKKLLNYGKYQFSRRFSSCVCGAES